MTSDNESTGQPAHVRIFISSPGDVADERHLARTVIERLRYEPGLRGRLRLEPVAWDRPGGGSVMIATLTPQEAINRGLPRPSQCDIVVVVLWTRIGTPLPAEYEKADGTPYLSGTEWEFEDAVQAWRDGGLPDVLVYRRTEVPSVALDDPQLDDKRRQREQVQEFFQRFRNPDGSIAGGVNEYATPSQFERALEEHLRVLLWQRLPQAAEAGGHDPRDSEQPDATGAPEFEGNPFPGLRAFGEDDAPVFFGRGPEVDGVMARLREPSLRCLTVIGPSGSGKSSLIAAGVVPRIAGGALGPPWPCLRFTPGEFSDDPFLPLAARLAGHLQSVTPATLAEELRTGPAALAERAGEMLAPAPASSELLLFVDQLEELFTRCAPAQRAGFAALVTAPGPRVRVVATLRADFFQRCLELPALARALRTGTYTLAPPEVGALHEMITRPAERAGLRFEEGLERRILEHAGAEPGAMPLMAYALEELYLRREGSTLTVSAYDAFGGVRGAIGTRAEAVYSACNPRARAALGPVFRELTAVDARGVATRRRAILGVVIAGDPGAESLVEALREARLLVAGRGEDAAATVEVAHEALFTRWPTLAKWIEERAGDLRALRQLEGAAEEWSRQAKDADYLWSGPRLHEAGGVIQRMALGDSLAVPGPSGDEPKAPDANHNGANTDRPLVGQFLAASRRRRRRRNAAGAAALALVALLLGGMWVDGWLHRESVTVTLLVLGRLGKLDFVPTQTYWVEVPAGRFSMGSEADDADKNERPMHDVEFAQPFRVGRYEVTFEEFAHFADASARTLSDWGWGLGRQPAINVSWEDATAYVRWLSLLTGTGYRLPTEAEWEYAARAGTGSRFSFGDDEAKLGDHAWFNENSEQRAHEVGTREPNPWGLYDMHGNVWEWVQDCWHESYESAPNDGRAWESANGGDCGLRVVRGGSWFLRPRWLRSSSRLWYPPGDRTFNLGFRLAQDM